MGERASVDKLLIRISRIATGSVEILGHTNSEMNERSHGANPMVQVNLSMIGGIMLLFTV
jgi:hypothetical protein